MENIETKQLIAASLPNAMGISMTFVAEFKEEKQDAYVIRNVAKVLVVNPPRPDLPPQVLWQSEAAFDVIDEDVTLPKSATVLVRKLNPNKDQKLFQSHEEFMKQLRLAKSGLVTAKQMPPEKKLLID